MPLVAEVLLAAHDFLHAAQNRTPRALVRTLSALRPAELGAARQPMDQRSTGSRGSRWRRQQAEPPHRLSTITASQLVAVGGNPVSNLALTSASLLPWRATVVGTWNRGLVMTPSTVALDRSELSFSSVT